MPRRFEALLLDFDGVLVDSAAATEGGWRAWAARHGLDPDAVARSSHGIPTAEHVARWAPALDAAVEAEAVERAAALEPVRAYPGAAELLALVPRVAIVTSAGRALVRARLRRTALPEPAVLVTADDVERGKPAPDPYRLAASRLGVRPEASAVVEDSPAGVAAGRAAGAFVVAIASTHAGAELAAADACFADLEAAVAALLAGR